MQDIRTGGAGRPRAGKGGHARRDQGWKRWTLIKVEEKELIHSVGKKRRKATGNKNDSESQLERLVMCKDRARIMQRRAVGIRSNGEPLS